MNRKYGKDNELSKYHRGKRSEKLPRYIKVLQDGRTIKRSSREINGPCIMLMAHHEMLKDDPEHLTTQFLKELTGIKCHCGLRHRDQSEAPYER